jgi:predicted dehydrogenase (TIGR03970 family)
VSALADVLIVGAGSAGSILAERLSADPSRRVTVLEAGPDRRDVAIRALTDPAAVLPIGPDSPVVRRYPTALTGDPKRLAEIVRGSCLGGSGAVNGGYFCRPPAADFGHVGPGWSWADVEPHFRGVERRIAIRRVSEFTGPTADFLAAAGSAGFRWLPDLNADPVGANTPPGLAAVPLNIGDGVRRGPGAVFLEPALDRPNLTALTGVRVTRLLVAGQRVAGVHAVGPHGPTRLHADRVVLCAGAVDTARLLLGCGIGPARDLAYLGIPVVADLPVGQRFSDHPEWLLSTGWDAVGGHPVLEAVLVTDVLEVRPYTTGFGSASPNIGVALMRPRARGRLSLVSADPDIAPRIEHRYDSEPADVAELRRGADLVAEIIRGATELGAAVWSTSQHLCGTAPIGEVVDPQCRVLGVDALSVVDGSILPTVPGRGPHAAIAMLAHRAAGFF